MNLNSRSRKKRNPEELWAATLIFQKEFVFDAEVILDPSILAHETTAGQVSDHQFDFSKTRGRYVKPMLPKGPGATLAWMPRSEQLPISS